jgi:multidrug efflux system outer membrane protein
MRICVQKTTFNFIHKRLLTSSQRPRFLTFFSYTVIIALPILGLTACMQDTLPNLAQPLPANWQQHQADSVLPAPDLRNWWKAFNAPDLDALVDQSLTQNLSLAAAREHITSARILSKKNYSNFLPDLHFRTGDISSPSATSSYFQASLDTTWELGLFGKKNASQQIADGQFASVEAQSQMARVTLVAEVVRTWVQLRTAQHQVQLLDELLKKSQQQLTLTLTRIHLGLSARSALLTINTMRAKQTEMRQSKQLEIDQALQQLALLQGKTSSEPTWAVLTTQPVIDDFKLQTLPVDVIRIRPDIQQAQANVLQSAGEFGLARAARYPSINLSGSFIYSLLILGQFTLHTFDDNSVAAVGPVIDMPLFDWGLRKAAADSRASELKAATLNYRQTVLEAVSEVESSLAAVNSAKLRIDQQFEVMRLAKQALNVRDALINLGLSSPLEALDEQQTTLQAQIDLSDMQMEHDLAYVAVYKALGGASLDTPNGFKKDSADAKYPLTPSTHRQAS